MGQIELSDCAIRLEGGSILHLLWNVGTRIEAENARAAMESVNALAEGKVSTVGGNGRSELPQS
ncbi:hypothetical protein GCM10010052_20050 [Paenarthrobacter histidinolovorans]|nr:hypothetical protein GCM10010052_20050 [Paenarthrobacter histidinolovorans]